MPHKPAPTGIVYNAEQCEVEAIKAAKAKHGTVYYCNAKLVTKYVQDTYDYWVSEDYNPERTYCGFVVLNGRLQSVELPE
jgi:hypothetical protein